MKNTLRILLTAGAFGLPACDQAKDAAAEASAQAKASAAEASAKAEAAMPNFKQKATEAMDAAKEAGAIAFDKAKAAGSKAVTKGSSAIDSAREWGLEKMGVPEADGLLEGFGILIAEAKAAVSSGMNGEKAAVLKAKWDTLYAKSADTIKNLDPARQEKLKAILASVKAKWDDLMAKPKDGTVE